MSLLLQHILIKTIFITISYSILLILQNIENIIPMIKISIEYVTSMMKSVKRMNYQFSQDMMGNVNLSTIIFTRNKNLPG